jgi:hypothetical protein
MPALSSLTGGLLIAGVMFGFQFSALAPALQPKTLAVPAKHSDAVLSIPNVAHTPSQTAIFASRVKMQILGGYTYDGFSVLSVQWLKYPVLDSLNRWTDVQNFQSTGLKFSVHKLRPCYTPASKSPHDGCTSGGMASREATRCRLILPCARQSSLCGSWKRP